MRYLMLILISFLLAALVLYWFWFQEQTVKNTPLRKSGPIVFLGDSLVEGVGATQNHDMPSLLSQALGEPVLNFGVAGDTTALARARLEPVLSQKPRLTIVLLGGNDFLQKVPREQIALNLKTIIADLQSTGSAVLLLGVRSGILSGGSDEFYEEIAQETQSAFEKDVLKGIFGDPARMSDAIHPNDAGYALIVNKRILPRVKKILDQ